MMIIIITICDKTNTGAQSCGGRKGTRAVVCFIFFFTTVFINKELFSNNVIIIIITTFKFNNIYNIYLNALVKNIMI